MIGGAAEVAATSRTTTSAGFAAEVSRVDVVGDVLMSRAKASGSIGSAVTCPGSMALTASAAGFSGAPWPPLGGAETPGSIGEERDVAASGLGSAGVEIESTAAGSVGVMESAALLEDDGA